MASLVVPRQNSKEEAWEQLQAKLAQKRDAQVISMPRRGALRWVAAAAVILIVGALAYVFVLAETALDAGAHAATGFTTVELPDGSVAMLTPETKLNWSFSETRRELNLEGEAFFEVVSGVPFEVATPSGKVEVLGTSFSVYTNDQAFAVECVTGSVRVSDADAEATITAGQGVKRRRGVLGMPYEHEMEGPQWASNGEVSYSNADLNRVMRHVMQRFEVTVRMENISEGKEFSGTFVMSDPENTLQIIAKAMALEVKKEATTSYVLFERD